MDDMLKKNELKSSNLTNNIVKYSIKTLGFLLFLLILPLINLVIIWMTFKMFVLNGNTDFRPIIKFVGDKLKNVDGVDEEEYLSEEEFNSLTEDDVVLAGLNGVKK